DAMRRGGASMASWLSKARSPRSSWPPTSRVNGPFQPGGGASGPPGGVRYACGHRGVPPGARTAGVVQEVLYKRSSPNQRSNVFTPPEIDRLFVATNGIRPLRKVAGEPRSVQVAPASSDS